MSDALIQTERDGDIAIVTFNDPDRLNAMTEPMGQAIAETMAGFQDDDALRAVVLTGAGRAFSAGGDLDMIERMGQAGVADPGGATRAENRDFMGRFYRLYLSVRTVPVPVIAAMNGHAVGAGCCVALGCDIRIASEKAKIGLNFNRLGIHPGMAATWTLPRLVGPAHASELLYTGRLVDGAEAARIGLVNRIVAPEQVLPDALETAREIATAAPMAIRGTKRSLLETEARSLDEQLDREAHEQSLNYETRDLLEGIAASKERRAPAFEGR